MPLMGEKVLPEDILRKKTEEGEKWWFEPEEDLRPRAWDGQLLPEGHPAYTVGEHFSVEKLRELKEEQYLRTMESRAKRRRKNPWEDFALATYEDRELYAKVSVSDAQHKARERRAKQRGRLRIGDDVGTGPASPNAYVEIRPRPGPEEDGPAKEAVNGVVAGALGIPLPQASRLVELGAVWVYDDYYSRKWERVRRASFVEPHCVLRVFPNPERFSTCYVEDWRERVKRVDSDYVVVDKPPLLPCFARVSNGREALSQCLREALNVREWGGDASLVTDDFEPCHEIDDEASGLVVLSRHAKAVEKFNEWLVRREVVFEFVALCTGRVEKGTYRHFYEKTSKRPGQSKPALYEEIPPHVVKGRRDFDNWQIAEMEVVATADLPRGCSAVRVRVRGTGWRERIRAQLAMLGAPVLNDRAATEGTPVPPAAASAAGLVPGLPAATGLAPGSSGSLAPTLLGGAVDEATLRGPYGHKLQLLPNAKAAADRGVPQRPQRPVPVALHLARLEFGGRVITCAPPAYWPEGAAAAVAVKLTTKDLKDNVLSFIAGQGGQCRFGKVGGQFGVRVEWLEEHFVVDRVVGLVFASEDAKREWEAQRRVKSGEKAWGLGIRQRGARYKEKMMKIRDKYVAPGDWDERAPRYKQIKKGKVKPVNS